MNSPPLFSITRMMCGILLLGAVQLVKATPAIPPPRRNMMEGLAWPTLDFLKHRRGLEEVAFQNETEQRCSLCGNSSALLEVVVPPYTPNNESLPPGLTCADFDSFGYGMSPSDPNCFALQTFFPYCCEIKASPYECEQRTRSQILKNMDTVVVPTPSYQESLNVSVLLNFYTIADLDVQQGTAEMFVWLSLVWKDPRLAWTLGVEDTCAPIISVRASMDAETTEIWVPDFDLYNRVTSVHSFQESLADVSPDGTVRWTRAGSLGAICQFSGLAKIPFDTLGCQLLFGGQSRLGLFGIQWGRVNYVLDETYNGFIHGDYSSTYAEYKLVEELVEVGKTYDDDIIFYTFYFQRARTYYMFNIVVPTTILTFISFGTFLLDLRLGERLSYGMALTLVVVAQQIVTVDLLPVSNERLWIDKFVNWSFYWVIFGLVESVFVGYVFFTRADHRRTVNEEVGKEEDEEKESFQPLKIAEDEIDDPLGSHSAVEKTANTVSESRKNSSKPTRSWCWPRKDWFYSYPLRKIDHFCFFFSVATYTIFLIGMFTSVPLWGRQIDPVYQSSSK